MAQNRPTPIPNINIGKVYDSRYGESDINIEAFGKLAEFFGRNMPVHRHDRFFQLHYLASGQIRLYLEEQQYLAQAPLFFFTPPTVPHAFITEADAEGFVLTVRQELVRQLLHTLPAPQLEPWLMQPACVELQDEPAARRLPLLLGLLSEEFMGEGRGREAAMQGLTQLILVAALRLSQHAGPTAHFRREDLQIFHRFNALIEAHYREHWSLWRYGEAMGVTESRLNDICRRMADLPSKRLIHDRLLQEARRLLIFSASSVNEIAYHLGFKDPAYFSRFFLRETGLKPSDYRRRNS
ncbi:4-hydroxyphenylacetate catabolism regulatory protein HpaA [Aquitalea magnusonii]|uniref:AraC family transcriptional regulator n=1 Tax=Aquitalea magnusonii TaxID=332411 RepID=A0A318JLM9_9NEIS|nr:4-hydroxyphenylacetate catabolism regulatory protein HpaA [Aquitalea magnusonii]PXX49185.1 AraC family transcriptional regulator [Aquitalea magnusonii]